MQCLFIKTLNIKIEVSLHFTQHASVVYGFCSFSCEFSPKVARRFWCGWCSSPITSPSHLCCAPVCAWGGVWMHYITLHDTVEAHSCVLLISECITLHSSWTQQTGDKDALCECLCVHACMYSHPSTQYTTHAHTHTHTHTPVGNSPRLALDGGTPLCTVLNCLNPVITCP